MPHKSRDDYNAYMRKYVLARYHRRMAEARERLGGRCAVCGTTTVNIDFDHVDPTTKVASIAKLAAGGSDVKFWTEVAKCQLLCTDHHKEKTRTNREYRKAANRIVNPEHGTGVCYYREKCRCERCRQWKRDNRAGLVDARGRSRPPIALMSGAVE